MKYMNMLKKYWSMELQLFAGEDDPGDNGSEEDLSLIHISEPTRP